MNDYEIIDAHIHLFRNIEQERATIADAGRRDIDYWGNTANIIPYLDNTGISRVVFLNLLPTKYMREARVARLAADLSETQRREAAENIEMEIADRIRRHNEWACQTGREYPRLIPFVGVHKPLGVKGMAEEASLRFRQGAKGVKIHPGFHEFYPDDRDLWPLFETCQSLGMPVLSDSGCWEGSPAEGEYGEPFRFASVLRDFPRLTLILAHLGSAFWDERLDLARQFPNVYFDTAQGFSAPDRAEWHDGRGLNAVDVPRIVRKIGVERIMFGSDGSAYDPVLQITQILRLNLTESEKRLILAGNARRIMNLGPGNNFA